MKKLIMLLTGLLIGLVNVNATTPAETSAINTSYGLGYGNSFIFVENNIEFSVFPDGQFDFVIPNQNPNISISVNTNAGSFSFNSGYDVLNGHFPFKDYYGRVNQIGSIFINYNNRGFIRNVGGLYIHYNNYNVFSHCTGFINVYNRVYIHRPWHTYYRIPPRNYCVVYNRPYRVNYVPVRYAYHRPFANNYRRTTAVATRRGHTISRNRSLATNGRGLKRADYSNYRRNSVATNNSTRTRSNATSRTSNATRSSRTSTSANNKATRTRTRSTIGNNTSNNGNRSGSRTRTSNSSTIKRGSTSSRVSSPRKSSTRTSTPRVSNSQSRTSRNSKTISSPSRNTSVKSRSTRTQSRSTNTRSSSRSSGSRNKKG